MSGWYDETHAHTYIDSDVEMQEVGCMCNFLAKTLKFLQKDVLFFSILGLSL